MFNGHHYSEQRHNDGEVKKLQALTTWITNIVLFILLATIINLLLPNSSFQKYTKLVVGLLLMLIIITPVFQIFKVDVNQMLKSLSLSSIRSDHQVENSIENQKKRNTSFTTCIYFRTNDCPNGGRCKRGVDGSVWCSN